MRNLEQSSTVFEVDSSLTYTMVVGDVAEVLGVTVTRVHQLDAVLPPARRASGHRRYDPRRVLAVLRQRQRAQNTDPAPRSRAH